MTRNAALLFLGFAFSGGISAQTASAPGGAAYTDTARINQTLKAAMLFSQKHTDRP